MPRDEGAPERDPLLLPAGKLVGRRPSSDERPRRSATRASRTACSAFGTRRIESPKTMFSAAERCGNSA